MKSKLSADEFQPKITKYFYTVLLIIGLGFYLIWGILYDGWFDVGVYAVTIFFVMFGLTGTVFYTYIENLKRIR